MMSDTNDRDQDRSGAETPAADDLPRADDLEVPAEATAPEMESTGSTKPAESTKPAGAIEATAPQPPGPTALGVKIVAGLAFLLALFAFAAATVTWLRANDPGRAGRIAALEEESAGARQAMTALEAKLADMADADSASEGRLAALEAAPPDEGLAAMRGDLDALSDRLQAVEVRRDGQGPDGAELASRIAALEARLETTAEEVRQAAASSPDASAALDERLAAVEAALAARAQESAVRVGDIESRLTVLEGAVAEVKAERAILDDLRARSAELGEGIAALTARLEASPRAPPGGAAALALAAGQLRDAVQDSAPYGNALDMVRAMTGDDPGLAELVAALDAHAAAGVATGAELRARYARVAQAVVEAARSAEREGWVGQALARLARAVSFRRTGEVAGETAEARVARAELKLEAGDLAGAVAELSGLEGPAAAAAAAWLDAARARLAVDRAVTALEAAVIARLAPGDDGAQ